MIFIFIMYSTFLRIVTIVSSKITLGGLHQSKISLLCTQWRQNQDAAPSRGRNRRYWTSVRASTTDRFGSAACDLRVELFRSVSSPNEMFVRCRSSNLWRNCWNRPVATSAVDFRTFFWRSFDGGTAKLGGNTSSIKDGRRVLDAQSNDGPLEIARSSIN